jgi:ribosomal protein S18 acetylase RimI-like enzyme
MAYNLRLDAMTGEALRTWIAQMWVGYRESIIAAGDTPEAADANIERNRAALFDGDDLAPGNDVFAVLDGDARVGVVWIGHRAGAGGGDDFYIYDIEIDEARRGQGYGRATMELAARWVREHGGTRLTLNVFGNNTVARTLYTSLGYRELAVTMIKEF